MPHALDQRRRTHSDRKASVTIRNDTTKLRSQTTSTSVATNPRLYSWGSLSRSVDVSDVRQCSSSADKDTPYSTIAFMIAFVTKSRISWSRMHRVCFFEVLEDQPVEGIWRCPEIHQAPEVKVRLPISCEPHANFVAQGIRDTSRQR